MNRRPAKPPPQPVPARNPTPERESPSIRDFQRRLTDVVAEWCRQLRSSSDLRAAEEPRPRAVVRPIPTLVEPFEVSPLLQDTPLAAFDVRDNSVLATVRRHSLRLLAELVSADAGLRMRLCELATEAAAGSCLLEPEDTFEVTLHGVLTAVSLANLFVVLARLTKSRTGAVEDVRLVERPLELLAVCDVPRASGDVWIALLAARTANALMGRAAKGVVTLPEVADGQAELPPVTVFGRAAAAVIRGSGLMKLVDSPRIHEALAAAVGMDELADVPVIATRPGCGAARRLVASEVAHNLARRPERPKETAAMASLLHTLDRFDEPAQRHSASLLVGHVVWELLESDGLKPAPKSKPTATRPPHRAQTATSQSGSEPPAPVPHILQIVTSRGSSAQPLVQAIRQFERHATGQFEGDDRAEGVARVRSVLLGYEAYRRFLQDHVPSTADLRPEFRLSPSTQDE